jgi:hypothetical protein
MVFSKQKLCKYLPEYFNELIYNLIGMGTFKKYIDIYLIKPE